jgi:rare lipoprotein A
MEGEKMTDPYSHAYLAIGKPGWAKSVSPKVLKELQRSEQRDKRLHSAVILVTCLILSALICLFFAKPVRAETLQASWYSIESLKKEGTYKYSKGVMANGKYFNDNNLTCATRLFPLGTLLCITNANNEKSVVVKTTDRIGKRFAKTRIDLSKGAFSQIANLDRGLIPIKVEVIK